MCGIVAYIGEKNAYPIIMKGLHRLEYRGYDSAGIALLNNTLNVYKCKGKVSDLETHIAKGVLKVPLELDILVGLHMEFLMMQMHILTILRVKI